ncbi:MAG: sulfurtransferase-like selenium metabolism protein YedF, partial [bacterium]|nr:sulfurtransferase-like selenium metabolism protein YedF [bacterium]
MITIDNRGLKCPEPVINTKKALDELPTGTIISIVDNTIAKENVLKFARSQGCSTSIVEEKDAYHIFITRQGAKATLPLPTAPVALSNGILYLIAAEEFGGGSPELGKTLLKTFLYSLSESNEEGAAIVFLNGGAKLTCDASPVLSILKKLSDKGWQIST